MSHININTQETIMPNTVGAAKGVTWENSQDILKNLGWRLKPELPPVMDGFERLSVTYVEGDGTTAQAIYTDTLIQDRLDREAIEAQAEAERQAQQAILDEENRQLNKSIELKTTENKFLIVCEQLTGSRNKLGFPELETIIGGMVTNENPLIAQQGMMLSVQLLTINSAGVRYGGTLWWDDVNWHPELVNS